MTSVEADKSLVDAGAQDPDGKRVQRLLFLASTLVLVLVVPVLIGTISGDVHAAGAADTGAGAQAEGTAASRAIDAKKVDAKKADGRQVDAKKVEAKKVEAKKVEAKKSRGTVPVYFPPDP